MSSEHKTTGLWWLRHARWQGVGFYPRVHPQQSFRWTLVLGWLEIRRWA